MIDAHHHIWRQKDLPWLLGPAVPGLFGPYEDIQRDYDITEFQADLTGAGIARSVYVQSGWAPNWFEDEVAWVQDVALRHGTISGIVAFADVTQKDVVLQLERLKKYPLMRGIRQQFQWHVNPNLSFARHPDLCRSGLVRKNIARLSDYGWSFDLQVFPGQMDGAVELARACPEVTFILQHAGLRDNTAPDGYKIWKEGMRRLADCPNVVTKLSAPGAFIHRIDADLIATTVIDSEKLFGSDRCMFGSNFPIEKLWTSYFELFQAFQNATAALSKKKRAAIFNDTAARIYRL